jgi:hypothetical protein
MNKKSSSIIVEGESRIQISLLLNTKVAVSKNFPSLPDSEVTQGGASSFDSEQSGLRHRFEAIEPEAKYYCLFTIF